jgi:hypothetical protein
MLQDMKIELLQAELRLLFLKRERAKIRANETRKGELQQRTYDRPTTVTKKSGEPDYARFQRTTGVNVFVNQSGWPVGADTVQSGWPDNTKLCERGRPVTMRSSVAGNVLEPDPSTTERGASAFLESPVELERAEYDQCVVINDMEGAACTRSPTEVGELIGKVPIVQLKMTYEQSGELDRTDFDQCVVSNAAGDVASEKWSSVKATASSGELDRTVFDQCV